MTEVVPQIPAYQLTRLRNHCDDIFIFRRGGGAIIFLPIFPKFWIHFWILLFFMTACTHKIVNKVSAIIPGSVLFIEYSPSLADT